MIEKTLLKQITKRDLIGEYRGVPFTQPGDSPNELILKGGNIDLFNEALKEGRITAKRLKV